jgi:crossover junction endodeoxyribonuclease RuvC
MNILPMLNNMKPPEIILGIDPGFGRMGWGVIKQEKNNTWRALGWGCVQTPPQIVLSGRLLVLRDELKETIKKYRPTSAAVEQLFFFNNAKTAMDVGQARGVILLTIIDASLKVAEFTPLQVKQAMTGYGRAEKGQIQKMVAIILGLKEKIKSDDAADALAIALCAAQSQKWNLLCEKR